MVTEEQEKLMAIIDHIEPYESYLDYRDRMMETITEAYDIVELFLSCLNNHDVQNEIEWIQEQYGIELP